MCRVVTFLPPAFFSHEGTWNGQQPWGVGVGGAVGPIQLKNRVISLFPHLGIGTVWKWIYWSQGPPVEDDKPSNWFHPLGIIRPISSRVKSNYLTVRWQSRAFFFFLFSLHPFIHSLSFADFSRLTIIFYSLSFKAWWGRGGCVVAVSQHVLALFS